MARLRIAGSSLVVAVFVMGGIDWTPDRGFLRAAPSIALNLRLTTADNLPPISKGVLVSEAAAIWRQEGIGLHWLSGGDAREGATLRVLVMPRTVGASADGEPWPVGELLRFHDSGAIAVASIAGALRVLNESDRFRLLDVPALREHRLGLVLGRAVAHEIGHYLLQTNAHADSGLMRARIGAAEFADPRGSFQLDEATQRQLLQCKLNCSRLRIEVP
jgi:hypothetical protein